MRFMQLERIMSNANDDLAHMMRAIPIYPSTEEIRVPCPDEEKFEIVERISAKAQEKYTCSTIDGVRIIYPDGWGLIRASNTQPVMVVRCEGRTQQALEEIMSDVKSRVLSEGLPDFTWTF